MGGWIGGSTGKAQHAIATAVFTRYHSTCFALNHHPPLSAPQPAAPTSRRADATQTHLLGPRLKIRVYRAAEHPDGALIGLQHLRLLHHHHVAAEVEAHVGGEGGGGHGAGHLAGAVAWGGVGGRGL